MRTFLTGLVAGALAVCAGYAIASRNSSGTMSAINGPYQPGTPISSTIVNARLADIENELTDSLSRSGKGGMTAAFKVADGTVAAPAVSFTNEAGTGWYRIGATDVGFAIAGTKKLELTSALFTVVPAASFSSTLGVTGAATLSSTLGVTGDFAVNTNKFTVAASSGNTLVAGTFGVTGSVAVNTDKFTVTASNGNFAGGAGSMASIAGTGTTLAAGDTLSLVTGASNGFLFVDPSTNSSTSQLIFGYNTNKQAAAVDTFQIYNNSADRTQLFKATTRGTGSGTNMITLPVGVTIGASGTATTQMNFGSCTLNGGTPATCTATVAAGAKCVAVHVGTSSTSDAVLVNLVTTTLTVTSNAGRTNAVNYVCF